MTGGHSISGVILFRDTGSRTHDGHVHYVYQNEAFLKITQLRRGTSQVDKTENGKLPAVKGKPACARVNVHRLPVGT